MTGRNGVPIVITKGITGVINTNRRDKLGEV
jgi:hypothetical protein